MLLERLETALPGDHGGRELCLLTMSPKDVSINANDWLFLL